MATQKDMELLGVKATQEEEERKRASKVMARFGVARNARVADGIETIWRENEALYNQETDDKKEGVWKSQAFAPHATREVNVAVPHLVAAIIDSDELVTLRAVPGKSEADSDYAKAEQTIINHQLVNKMDFPNRWELFCQPLALHGTSVAFVGFGHTKHKFEYQEPTGVDANGETTFAPATKDVVVDASNVFVPLELSHVWVDPTSTVINIPRLWLYEAKSIRDLKKIPHIKNLDKLSADPPSAFSVLAQRGTSVSTNETKIGLENANIDQTGLDDEDKLHHIIQEWDYKKQQYTIVADGNVEILASRVFPFKARDPFVWAWYNYRPGNKFYGIGVVEQIANSNRQANNLRRMRNDNVNLSINRPFIIKEGALTNEKKELKYGPGRAIHTRFNIDGSIKQLDIPNVTQNAYTDEQIIKGDIDAVNGLHSIIEGKGDPNARTATGSAITQKNAILRLKNPIRKAMSAFKKVCVIMRAHNNQFLSAMEKEFLIGPSARLYQMYKESWEGQEVELSVHPAKLYDNEDLKNQQLLNALNIIGNIGLMPGLDQNFVLRYIMKRIGGVDETSEMFVQKSPLNNVEDFMDAMADIRLLAQGQDVFAQPDDNHQVHIEMLKMYAQTSPPLAPAISGLIKQHEQQAQLAAAKEAGMMGQGGPPQTGGVNPAREVSPSSEQGMVQSMQNQMGAGNGVVGAG